MLSDAVSSDALEASPAAVIERNVTYNAKQRALSDEELEGLFRALPKLKMQLSLRELMLFQILTAVRPSEAGEARWGEIDLETRRWIIPKERMKMKKEHLIPLALPAIQIVERIEASSDKGYVFAGEKGEQAIQPPGARRRTAPGRQSRHP
jgi:integrase